MAGGEVIVFVSCDSRSARCSGTLSLRLAEAPSLVPLPPGFRPTGRSRHDASFSEEGSRVLLARRKVKLRERRVSPVILRLSPAAIALLSQGSGPIEVEAVSSERRHSERAEMISLQLAGGARTSAAGGSAATVRT